MLRAQYLRHVGSQCPTNGALLTIAWTQRVELKVALPLVTPELSTNKISASVLSSLCFPDSHSSSSQSSLSRHNNDFIELKGKTLPSLWALRVLVGQKRVTVTVRVTNPDYQRETGRHLITEVGKNIYTVQAAPWGNSQNYNVL